MLQGICGTISVPLCKVFLRSELCSGYVTVGVQDSLPIPGVTFLLGNDLAGGKVITDPIVTPYPSLEDTTDIFPSCAVTRSMERQLQRQTVPSSEVENDPGVGDLGLSNLFAHEEDEVLPVFSTEETEIYDSTPITREMLVNSQRNDPELVEYVLKAVSEKEAQNYPQCFYFKDDILMKKYRPAYVSANEVWKVTHQIVVPSCYRKEILSLAHDYIGGHLGINKTYNKILQHFYWPKLKKDVTAYCNSCHTCQLSGKPNQPIKSFPLQPIPVVEEPFSKIFIDCVGPLPKSRNGNQFILTIMCTSTRYSTLKPFPYVTSLLKL